MMVNLLLNLGTQVDAIIYCAKYIAARTLPPDAHREPSGDTVTQLT